MQVRLVDVPYDCGLFDVRMGRGPSFLLNHGLAGSLRTAGHQVGTSSVRLPAGFHTEWDALAGLQQQIATLVRSAAQAGELPVILSGNCGPAALGALAGLRGERAAVCWFDAHADFNTPNTSASGFLDGMALAIATGQCWPEAARRLQLFDVLPEDRVALIGARAVDPLEEAALHRSGLVRIGAREAQTLPAFLRRVAGAALYVHVDLDVVDAGELRANAYASSEGLSVDELVGLITTAAGQVRLAAASVTALDPACDPDRAWPVTERVIQALADAPSIKYSQTRP